MFTSTGLFKDIPCPKLGQCQLVNCIFSHDRIQPAATQATICLENAERTDQVRDGDVHEPQRKRRRISLSTTTNRDVLPQNPPSLTEKTLINSARDVNSTKPDAPAMTKTAPNRETYAAIESKVKPVSPPPVDNTKKAVSQQTSRPFNPPAARIKKEALFPRPLDHAPASHPIRMALLEKLHAAMTAINDKAAKDAETGKSFVLSVDELVTMALDEEETTATKKPTIYTNVLKTFIVQLKKMDLVTWRKHVAEVFKSKFMPADELHHKKPAKKAVTTGLTPEQEVMILHHMRTPLEGLESHGYVTSPPSAEEIKAAKEGVTAAKGFETCERCKSRFQVFPGRREEDGALTSGGTCTYHWAKPIKPQRQKTDHITGHRESYWPCCNEGMSDSTGCTRSPHHVFKVSEAKRLASIIQFERTPDALEVTSHAMPLAVAYDAEMGYTTLGLEIIRLTAVSWPSGDSLLDVLVRPLGEILDLNTRFSGITLSQMANAPAYTDLTPNPSATSSTPSTTSTTPAITTVPSVSEDGEIPDTSKPSAPDPTPPLRIVPSPQAARSLLFSLLTPQTPLIGHAIDNDLNATRIIHPFIVDTVLLYPHPRGLPARLGLKALASRYLERDIQRVNFGAARNADADEGGGIQGHDSKEDAVATGDLVRVKVGEKWKAMKREGWKFEGDTLVAPVAGKKTT